MFASAVGDKMPSALVAVVKYDSDKDEFVNDIVDTSEYFKGKKIDVVKDCIKGYLGPLAGILTGMKWLKKKLTIVFI